MSMLIHLLYFTFPAFSFWWEFCNYFSTASACSGRQCLFTRGVSTLLSRSYYEGIWLQELVAIGSQAFGYRYPIHPADSLRGDICYRRASLCFPILNDSDREDIV
jgi:hypothetical protein